MSLTDVKESWAAHYKNIPLAVREKGIEDAVRWIVKRGPWTYNNLRRRLFASLGIGQGTSLLQAGSGIGKSGIAEALLAGCQVTLLDYSSRVLESAREVLRCLAERYPQIVSRVCVVQGSFESLAFENCFDISFNEGVLEHWFEDAQRVEILRLLAKPTKVGGKVMVFVPNQKNHLYRARIAKLSAMDLPCRRRKRSPAKSSDNGWKKPALPMFGSRVLRRIFRLVDTPDSGLWRLWPGCFSSSCRGGCLPPTAIGTASFLWESEQNDDANACAFARSARAKRRHPRPSRHAVFLLN